ncbi:signal peptidase II [Erythrobacter arachoides]|uniref:Lipoprotein signal peptidase n=1 Tax=Aurantiacibacter arachoides TaxID=1850444 RepID=A0A845A6D6_9SPHN|nr:signal peptidase II [Aurantiacibacter arachoides]MXO94716.1 signal peptidase II [Aurantiacibacter arachoides]GGD61212.1 lipoprotein signal peptidase [Aurantiacibacter arachoides]
MTSLRTFRVVGFAIALAIFVIDQWVKYFVVEVLQLDRVNEVEPLLPFFDLRRANNYGVSLGMFEATSMEMRWILVAVTAAIAMGVVVWMLRERKGWDIAALGMVLGGALGNIRDRWMHGYVIDYADLHFGDFRPFLIFNVADAAITIGVVIILLRALFSRETEAQGQDAAQTQVTATPHETREPS